MGGINFACLAVWVLSTDWPSRKLLVNPRGRNWVHIMYGNRRKVHDSESEPMPYDTTDRGRGNVTFITLICDNSVTNQNY